MKGLLTLTKMQLKDKIDFSAFKSVKKAIFKVVLTLLKFAVITAVIFAGFYILSYLRLISLLPGIPQSFMTIVFTFMYSLSIVVCIFGMMKSFYFAKDNQVLLTMPVSRTTVFTSKLVVYYIYEFIRNLTYLLPLFVAYGMINSVPWFYYLWLIPMMFILTLLPVALGALLSIPLLLITTIVKNNKWLEYILVALFIGGIVTLLVLTINAIPENFDLIGSWGTTFQEIQTFMTKFTKDFAPFYYTVTTVCGVQYSIATSWFTAEQWFSVLGVIGACVIALALAYLLVQPLFFKMTSTPFEYRKKKVNKTFHNKKTNGFLSMIKKEIVLTYRTSDKFYGLLTSVIGMPLVILLLNKIITAMDTRYAGMQMGFIFNILLIMIMTLSSSINLAHAYSEEGASSYLLKTNPKSYYEMVCGKFVFQGICMVISLLTTVIIMSKFIGLSNSDATLVFFTILLFYVAHLFMSAEQDVMNPQTQQYQTTGGHYRDPNDIRSFLYAYMISAFVAFFAWFLMAENPEVVWGKMLFIAVLFVSFRTYLFFSKVKVYFKERQ